MRSILWIFFWWFWVIKGLHILGIEMGETTMVFYSHTFLYFPFAIF